MSNFAMPVTAVINTIINNIICGYGTTTNRTPIYLKSEKTNVPTAKKLFYSL